MAKYRGLAPWALGLAVLAHACASVTGLARGKDDGGPTSREQPEAGTSLGAHLDRALMPQDLALRADHERPR